MVLEGGEGSLSRPGHYLPPGKTRYPLYRRMGGPQDRSGKVRKISPPPGFDPRTVQPITSRYTDMLPPHLQAMIGMKKIKFNLRCYELWRLCSVAVRWKEYDAEDWWNDISESEIILSLWRQKVCKGLFSHIVQLLINTIISFVKKMLLYTLTKRNLGWVTSHACSFLQFFINGKFVASLMPLQKLRWTRNGCASMFDCSCFYVRSAGSSEENFVK